MSISSSLRLSAPRTTVYLTIVSLLFVAEYLRSQSDRNQAVFASSYVIAQDEAESTWRKTRLGWVDSRQWNRRPPVKFERRIELIHPFVFSAMVVLCSVGLLLWASEEHYWWRLMQTSKSKPLERNAQATRNRHHHLDPGDH